MKKEMDESGNRTRTRAEWHDYCVTNGTSWNQVFDILDDWETSDKNKLGIPTQAEVAKKWRDNDEKWN